MDAHDENVEWELLHATGAEAADVEREELREPTDCEECGHPISVHTKYGCEIERGDAWVTGNQPSQPTVLMAQGPCGCQAWEAVDEIQEALQNAYDDGKALRKNKGLTSILP